MVGVKERARIKIEEFILSRFIDRGCLMLIRCRGDPKKYEGVIFLDERVERRDIP